MADHDTIPGFTWGGEDGATWGPPDGATWGPQTELFYRARLTTPTGRRADITAIETVDLAIEHTAVSDVSLTVPRIDGLGDFALGDLDVFFGDELLFQATLEKFPGPGVHTDETATLAGRGPARSLTRGDISVDYSGVEDVEAIRRCWSDHTDFQATVTPPAETTTLGEAVLEGSPMEVLEDLHERAGMRFTVMHTEPGKAVHSYPRGETREAAWTSINDDSTGDVTGYANRVIVKGGTKSDGTLARGEATDQAEVDALDGNVEPWTITDHTLTTDADCQALAEEELAKRAEQDSLSGKVEIIPELVLPGYHYQIPEWGVAQPIERVNYSESLGDATATLEVNAPEGVVETLASLAKTQSSMQRSLR